MNFTFHPVSITLSISNNLSDSHDYYLSGPKVHEFQSLFFLKNFVAFSSTMGLLYMSLHEG